MNLYGLFVYILGQFSRNSRKKWLNNLVGPCTVAGGCNTAIGGLVQFGCMLPVCHRSSSQLRISIRTMLKDAATLSWPGLVKQVQPSRDSCWLASANCAVASSSLGEGRTALQTIVRPGSCSSSSSCSSSGAARGSPWQRSC